MSPQHTNQIISVLHSKSSRAFHLSQNKIQGWDSVWFLSLLSLWFNLELCLCVYFLWPPWSACHSFNMLSTFLSTAGLYILCFFCLECSFLRYWLNDLLSISPFSAHMSPSSKPFPKHSSLNDKMYFHSQVIPITLSCFFHYCTYYQLISYCSPWMSS